LSLFKKEADFIKIKAIIKEYKLDKELTFFLSLLNERTQAPEIGLNKHLYKKLKTDIMTVVK
jgi:hypothetical protein